MACEEWRAKLDSYLDGELMPAEARTVAAHLRQCAGCAADALERAQLKRSTQAAGKRYQSSAELRARISASVAPKPRPGFAAKWKLVLIPALAALLAALLLFPHFERERAARQRVFSELADQHVATLASSTPVDVLSSDRHTVKPWFQGKIPFTFNLPELAGSEFTLVGGRVAYLEQTPGAHLIYQIRKHEISVFIFPESAQEIRALPSEQANALSFNTETWTQNGLRYFVIGDASADDIRALSKLLRSV